MFGCTLFLLEGMLLKEHCMLMSKVLRDVFLSGMLASINDQ